MIALLRRFWLWLKPYEAASRCSICGTTGDDLSTSRDGVTACPPCADTVIRAFTNRDMRRAAKHNLKRLK